MRIIQISDLHLPDAPGEFYDGIDTFARCRRLIAHLRGERADLLVVTGDVAAVSESGSCYVLLRQQLECLPYPWAVLPGNHDRGDVLAKVFGPGAMTGFDVRGGSEGAEVVFLDNSGEEADHLENLRRYLAFATKPVCLFTHYPPILVGHPSYDGKHRSPWQDRLMDVLQSAGVPIYVFFGHIHFEFSRECDGVSYFSVPSGTVPLSRGEGCDYLDDCGIYYRVIENSGSGWTTNLRSIPVE